jgi:hypothetical protein
MMANEVEIVAKVKDDTGKGFAGIANNVKKMAANAGAEGGTAMGKGMTSSLSGVLGTPVLGPIMIAAGGLAAAIMAPAFGAALAGAIPLALGGGILVAGITSAMKDEKVAKAFDGLTDKANKMFEAFGKPFRGPLMRAFDTFGKSLDRMSPAFERMGKTIAPVIDKLAPAFAEMAEKSMPGIEKAVAASVPLFELIAEHMPEIGEAISDFFTLVAEGMPGALMFFDELLSYIAPVIRALGQTIRWLSNMFVTMSDGWEEAKADFKDAAGDIRRVFRNIVEWGQDTWASITGGFNRARSAISRAFSAVGNAARNAVNAVRRVWNALPGALQSIMRNASNRVVSAARAIGSGVARVIRGAVGTVGNAVNAIRNRITGIFSNAGSWLVNAGRRIINGLISGIRNAGGAIRNAVRDVVPDFVEGFIPGFATGGVAGGLIMTGERGRELIKVPHGSQVIPNGQTERMMAGAGGGGPSEMSVYFDPARATGIARAIMEGLRAEIRTQGGNVQQVLGVAGRA